MVTRSGSPSASIPTTSTPYSTLTPSFARWSRRICFGPPLRLAALELVPAADAAEIRARDLPHARPHELAVLDVHAGAEERLDQASAFDDVEHRRLEGGPARLMMRREPLLDDARLDAVARQFAGGEKSRRAASHDQDGGRVGDLRHSATYRASRASPPRAAARPRLVECSPCGPTAATRGRPGERPIRFGLPDNSPRRTLAHWDIEAMQTG